MSRQHPALDELIIINLYNTHFKASPANSQVTADYVIQIHHLGLKPAKPEHCETINHSVTRSAETWMNGGQSWIHADIKQAIQHALTGLLGSR